MVEIELKCGGKPTLVRVLPSKSYPEKPHKVLSVVDAKTGQIYIPGPEQLVIEGFYQGKIDYELYQKRRKPWKNLK